MIPLQANIHISLSARLENTTAIAISLHSMRRFWEEKKHLITYDIDLIIYLHRVFTKENIILLFYQIVLKIHRSDSGLEKFINL